MKLSNTKLYHVSNFLFLAATLAFVGVKVQAAEENHGEEIPQLASASQSIYSQIKFIRDAQTVYVADRDYGSCEVTRFESPALAHKFVSLLRAEPPAQVKFMHEEDSTLYTYEEGERCSQDTVANIQLKLPEGESFIQLRDYFATNEESGARGLASKGE